MNYILGRDLNFLSLFTIKANLTFVVEKKTDFNSNLKKIKNIKVISHKNYKPKKKDKSYLSVDNIFLRKRLIKKHIFDGKVSKINYISPYSIIEKSTNIFQNCYIGPNTKIGSNCKINNNVSINHDCIIGNNVVIGPGTIINGNVKIGNNVYIGSNTTILNKVKIKKEVIVGAHSIITKNIEKKGIYYGTPARYRKNF